MLGRRVGFSHSGSVVDFPISEGVLWIIVVAGIIVVFLIGFCIFMYCRRKFGWCPANPEKGLRDLKRENEQNNHLVANKQPKYNDGYQMDSVSKKVDDNAYNHFISKSSTSKQNSTENKYLEHSHTDIVTAMYHESLINAANKRAETVI